MSDGELRAGSEVASYRIVRKLGEGGMGAVYEAEHEFTKRRVALKVIHAFRADADYKTRMIQEARALAQLDHPNVVRLIDANVTPAGMIWIAMELLDGTTLRGVCARAGRLPLDAALLYLIGACDGVAAGHALDIVHRDLKPENIFVTRQYVPKILDFGAAKAPSLGVRRTTDALESGADRRVIGTPPYMSPEHLKGHSVDCRTDVYALGIIGYEMLFQHPFRNRDGSEAHVWELVRRQLDDVPPLLSKVAPEVPEDVALAIHRALEKHPSRRWQSVADFAAALRQALDRRSSRPSEPSPAAARAATSSPGSGTDPLPGSLTTASASPPSPGGTDPMPGAPSRARAAAPLHGETAPLLPAASLPARSAPVAARSWAARWLTASILGASVLGVAALAVVLRRPWGQPALVEAAPAAAPVSAHVEVPPTVSVTSTSAEAPAPSVTATGASAEAPAPSVTATSAEAPAPSVTATSAEAPAPSVTASGASPRTAQAATASGAGRGAPSATTPRAAATQPAKAPTAPAPAKSALSLPFGKKL